MFLSGRLSNTIKKVLDFTSSLDMDKILYDYDIKGSLVHVKRLFEIEILCKEEYEKIVYGLNFIKDEFDKNEFKFHEDDEDVHMAIERRLIEIIGDTGKKLHTGRSRNDQVILDFRMFLKDNIRLINEQINILILSIIKSAEENKNVVMPGYTHLQQAQPILFSHYILSYAYKFLRDKERFEFAYKTCDVFPLGSGALAGTPYKIDRFLSSKELGFSNVSKNSLDAVSDRDFVIEFLYAASMFCLNVSRLAEDFIIYSSQEFAFLEMENAYTTTSSLMPQKKNPDIMELMRGKSERVIGSLNSFINVMKALPMSYNRDMQEDKYYILVSLNILCDFLDILPEVISTTKINKEKMRFSLDNGFLYATAIADYLVSKNMPFREAYKITGEIVNFCIQQNKSFKDLTIDEYKKFAVEFDIDVFDILDPYKIIANQKIHGSTSLESVELQIKEIKEILNA